MNVAVIGASNKPDRFSYKAVMLLKEKGHQVFPVHQRIQDIEGITVYPSILNIPEKIDTITLYVGRDISTQLKEEIIMRAPRRVIFNPGAENEELGNALHAQGILVLNDCTLVMLRSNLF